MTSMQGRSSKAKLYIRPFPCIDFSWECLKFDMNKKIIYVRHLLEFDSPFKQPLKFWCFPTSEILFNCCQEEVYGTTTYGLIEQVYDGYDSVLISYGQNYSGKSFTLSGLFNTFQLRGIIPRFLADLFEEQGKKLDKFAFHNWISTTDIRGGAFFDLLSNKKCETYKEITSVKINSATEGLRLLFKAEIRREKVGNVSYNAHAASNIVTLKVKVEPLNAQEPVNKVSKFHFVDLAGVETIERSPLTSFKERENQGQANVAKTLLEIYALRSNKNEMGDKQFSVNKRIHNITQYLGNSLEYSSNVRLICHIRPTVFDLKITLSLLKFGKSFQNICTNLPKPHLEQNFDKMLEHLQDKVIALQDDLLMRKLWGERQPIIISQDRIDFVKRAVTSFLKGDLSEYELMSLVDDYSLILNMGREIYKGLKNRVSTESASQTDEELNNLSIIKEDNAKNSVKLRQSFALRQSLTDASPTTVKKVSFGRSKKGSKQLGTKKNKGGKKSKEQEKPILQSEEVQVNLIEPFTKLPDVDSREGLWARFLIHSPEAQDRLDQLNTAVKEKKKMLNVEQVKYDDLRYSLNKVELNLDQLKSFRHIEGKETYDNDGKLIVSHDESNLVKKLQEMHKLTEISKQKLTDAQLDWLESMERLDKEKQQFENHFKQFCFAKNVLELDLKTNDNEQDVQTEENITNEPQKYSTLFQEAFELYQAKYLPQIS